ncbi:helix-turn-helix transcriptional regulator [Georgenia sp. H159]|uniref:helix-turn-helix transcriptional regulator n=1 Tax=Georgenia sp. H159 TaxID=3076115 RepID=UPI002D76CBEC|nr:LuxR C-terminal-related transcriptional regulator [Georgenia sp. H159]
MRSLLRHATGRPDTAWTALCAALAGRDRLACVRLLASGVEIALSLGLDEEAEDLCARLEETADAFATAGLRAWAAQARAHVLVARGRHREALGVLRELREHGRLPSRYETAQMYELMARAHGELGEPGAAAAARATALTIYRSLGAVPDVRRLDGAAPPGGLTEREVDVLSLVAAGASNRVVGATLFISEKTVSRHLANIFTKLGVSTRTAAAAWAHENRLRARR